MFATGQEWRVLLFCVQSAEEVWNANFMKIKGMKERSSWGSVGWEEWLQRRQLAGNVF